MLAIDIRLHEVQAKHRVSLFRLVKVEIGDLEPVYTKIPSVVDISNGHSSRETMAQRPSGFGSVLLVAETPEVVHHLLGNVVIRLEIYNDHNGPLDLICAGEKEIQLEPCSSCGFQRNLLDIHSQMLIKVAQRQNVSVIVKHFTQGQYKISAGQVTASITLYQVRKDMLVNNNGDLDSIVRDYDKFAEGISKPALTQSDGEDIPPPPPPLITYSEHIEIPELVTAEEINARLGFFTISEQKEKYGIEMKEKESRSARVENDLDVDTTREESWLDDFIEDDNDYNSVDEFIEEFLATRGRSLHTHGRYRRGSGGSGSSDTDRSHSPPPPPPPQPNRQRSRNHPTTSKNTKTHKDEPANKKIKHRSSSSHPIPLATKPLKPKRVSPHLIGAAADRGRWLFARPSDL